MNVKYWIDRYNETGRIAFWYPRKKQISLNGCRAVTERVGIIQIKDFLRRNGTLGADWEKTNG